MLRISIIFLLTFFSSIGLAAEESLDELFLVWLGQTADLEDIGMDIGQLIDEQQEMENQNEESQSQ